MGGAIGNRNLKWLHEFEEPYDGRLSRLGVPVRFCERGGVQPPDPTRPSACAYPISKKAGTLKPARETQYMAGHRYISSTEAYQQNELEELSEEVGQYHPF